LCGRNAGPAGGAARPPAEVDGLTRIGSPFVGADSVDRNPRARIPIATIPKGDRFAVARWRSTSLTLFAKTGFGA
jgi:hypothetical protein